MKRCIAVATLVLISVIGCKKAEPTRTPPGGGPKGTPVVPNSLATSRESASGAAAVTTAPVTQPTNGH